MSSHSQELSPEVLTPTCSDPIKCDWRKDSLLLFFRSKYFSPVFQDNLEPVDGIFHLCLILLLRASNNLLEAQEGFIDSEINANYSFSEACKF